MVHPQIHPQLRPEAFQPLDTAELVDVDAPARAQEGESVEVVATVRGVASPVTSSEVYVEFSTSTEDAGRDPASGQIEIPNGETREFKFSFTMGTTDVDVDVEAFEHDPLFDDPVGTDQVTVEFVTPEEDFRLQVIEAATWGGGGAVAGAVLVPQKPLAGALGGAGAGLVAKGLVTGREIELPEEFPAVPVLATAGLAAGAGLLLLGARGREKGFPQFGFPQFVPIPTRFQP